MLLAGDNSTSLQGNCVALMAKLWAFLWPFLHRVGLPALPKVTNRPRRPVNREDEVRDISAATAALALSDMMLISGALYLLPVLLCRTRHAPDLGTIAGINVLLGWTIIGWVVALAMALRPVGEAEAGFEPDSPAAQGTSQPPESRSPGDRHDLGSYRVGSPPPLVLPPRSAGSSQAR